MRTLVLFYPAGGQTVLESAGGARQTPVYGEVMSAAVCHHQRLLLSYHCWQRSQLSLSLFFLVKITQQASHQHLWKRLPAMYDLHWLLGMVVWGGDICVKGNIRLHIDKHKNNININGSEEGMQYQDRSIIRLYKLKLVDTYHTYTIWTKACGPPSK